MARTGKRRPKSAPNRTKFKTSVAKIARNVLNKNTETKTVVLHNSYTISTTNRFSANNKFDLFEVAQGDGQSSRDGNQIRVTALEYRLVFCLNESVITAVSQWPILIRVVEYTPRLNQDDDLSFSTINDYADLDMFAIHSDRLLVIYPTRDTAVVSRRKYFSRPIMVQSSGSAANSITKNARKLYFCYDCDGLKTLPAGNAVSLEYQYRVKYKDS